MKTYTVVGVYTETGKAYVDSFVSELLPKDFADLIQEQRQELEILAVFSGDLNPIYLN